MVSLRTIGAGLAVLGVFTLSACGGGDNGKAASSAGSHKPAASAPGTATGKASHAQTAPAASTKLKAGIVCSLVSATAIGSKMIGDPGIKFDNDANAGSSNPKFDPDLCTYHLDAGRDLIVNRFGDHGSWPTIKSRVLAGKSKGTTLTTVRGNEATVDDVFSLVHVGNQLIRVQDTSLQRVPIGLLSYVVDQLAA